MINKKRKQRITKIAIMVCGTALILSLLLYALRQNISLYYTPSQLSRLTISHRSLIRVGGFVVSHSVSFQDRAHKVIFAITDHHKKIWVHYRGVLPVLFREGQGIVVQGHLDNKMSFKADQVLAKHNATYHPPEVH